VAQGEALSSNPNTTKKKKKKGLVLVAHACNPTQEDHNLEASLASSLLDPISKYTPQPTQGLVE
jgi:hypothetical protein